MEDWRTKALGYLPELRETIEAEQGGPVGLWTQLFDELRRAYDRHPSDDDLIGRIYDYAGWCIDQPSTKDAVIDRPSAAIIGLIESIPLDERISADLHRWISEESFEGFENIFRYHLSDEGYRKFSGEFLRRKRAFNGQSRL
jgi:hypothetical protein